MNNNKSINIPPITGGKTKTSTMNKIGSSALHLIAYIVLLTMVSVAASAQCDNASLACNNGINISTNDECIAELCVDLMLENNVPGFTIDDFVLTLLDESDAPLTGTTASGNCITVNESHIGTIKAVVSLPVCGVSCWGYINIEDKVGPGFVECDGTEFGLGTSDITCEDFIAGIGVVVPTLAGSCNSSITPTFEDENTGVQCSGPYSGTIVRTWTATDASGNSSICKQRFRILKFDVSNVVFPSDTIHYLDASCNFPDTSPEGLGYPEGIECPNIMYTYNDILTETCGSQEKFLRDWFVIDWCTGESVTDGQVVKILDVSPPIPSCPLDTIFVSSNGFNCSAKVVLDPFAVIDSTSAPTLVTDCSGPVDIEVAYLPAIPGTNQPILGQYIPIVMGSDSLFTIPQNVEQAVWIRYCFIDACGKWSTNK